MRTAGLIEPKMAPIIEKKEKMGSGKGEPTGDDTENLWADLLSEVQSGSPSKLPPTRTVLVLGDNESGKTTLIAKLQGIEEPKKGSGLEYYYIDVNDEYRDGDNESGKTTLIAKLQGIEEPKKGSGLEYYYIDVNDEYRDEQARLNVWVLDGEQQHASLLKFALKESTFSDTLIMLVVSMSQPWTLLETLNKWVEVLSEHINKLRIPAETMQEYEQSLIRTFQAYTEPGDGPIATQTHPRGEINPLHPPASGSEEENNLPLGDVILSRNLGIPIVVVVTKSDEISNLEKEQDFKDEHFDFIQQHIRKFCLKYGAAMFYTSVKDERNCDLLYRYLVHRIYGFPFTSPALVVERESVFVPFGWDNEKKISILYDNMTTMKPDDPFEDVITKPSSRKVVQRDAEVLAEDDQVFLLKMQTQLLKQPTPGSSPAQPEPAPVRQPGPPAVQRTPVRNPTPTNTGTPVWGKDGKPQAGNTEGMLANFFNSLLSKTPGQASPTDKAAVTRDAAAELERMNRGKKPLEETTADVQEPTS